MAAEAVILQGWFVKKAEVVGRSRRRYFVLTAQHIEYHDGKDNGAKLKGTIALSGATEVVSEPPLLTICNPGRDWKLSAETASQAEQWCSAIQGVVRGLRERFGKKLQAILQHPAHQTSWTHNATLAAQQREQLRHGVPFGICVRAVTDLLVPALQLRVAAAEGLGMSLRGLPGAYASPDAIFSLDPDTTLSVPIQWLVEQVVKPASMGLQGALLERFLGMELHGDAAVGPAMAYLCHTWRQPWEQTYCTLLDSLNSAQQMRTWIWWDLFSFDFNQGTSLVAKELLPRCMQQASVLFVSLPDLSPSHVQNRLWCLVEIALAAHHNVPVEVVTMSLERRGATSSSLSRSPWLSGSKLAVDCSVAQTSVPEDAELLRQLAVQAIAEDGLDAIGQLVVSTLGPARDACALLWAAREGDVGAVDALLVLEDGGAHGHTVCDGAGQTPLHKAAQCRRDGSAAVVDRLIKAGADVDAQDSDGRTPLHVAATAGNAPAAEVLLAANADTALTDAFGSTPLDKARVMEKIRLIQLLEPATQTGDDEHCSTSQ